MPYRVETHLAKRALMFGAGKVKYAPGTHQQLVRLDGENNFSSSTVQKTAEGEGITHGKTSMSGERRGWSKKKLY